MDIKTAFDPVLNWTLKAGSHKFPGPDGGTCINEAAIVAAGFAYKKVSSASDCPPCFSRPLAAYALALNDAMPDAARQRVLSPFVLRLAGTADTDAIEQQRVDFIVLSSVRRILPVALNAIDLTERAQACSSVQTIEEARREAAWAAKAAEAGSDEVWEITADILDNAMKIGRQADPLDLALVSDRMARARAGEPALARSEA